MIDMSGYAMGATQDAEESMLQNQSDQAVPADQAQAATSASS